MVVKWLCCNSVIQSHKLGKEWKKGNTSKQKNLEAKEKARRVVYQTKCKAEMKRFGNVMETDDQK